MTAATPSARATIPATGSTAVPRPRRRGGVRVSFGSVVLWIVVAVVLIYLVFPVFIVAPVSFSSAKYLQFPPPGWSLQWYQNYFERPGWVPATLVSIRVAVITTILATVLGTAASLALVRGRFPGRNAVNSFIVSPLVVPGIIVAGLILAGGAYLRFARTVPKGRATDLLNWLVAPALGLLFGWLTAAAVVGMANTLNALGVSGQSLERVAGALLLFGGLVASVVVLVSRTGPSGAWVSYCAAVLWALAAIVVEQRLESTLTAGVAIVSAVLVLVAVFGPWQPLSYPRGRLALHSSPPDTQ